MAVPQKVIPRNCTACGLCEVACSFHHSGKFGRLPSSIGISKDPYLPKVEIRIREADGDGRRACDSCQSEESPRCAYWCPAGAIVGRAA